MSGITYDNATRGKILFPERRRQLFEFDGLRIGTKTGTDIDFFMDDNNQSFVFMEFKLEGTELPYGQELALVRLVDAIKDSIYATLMICEHCEHDVMKIVDAATTIVKRFYFKGKWYDDNRTAKEALLSFYDFVSKHTYSRY